MSSRKALCALVITLTLTSCSFSKRDTGATLTPAPTASQSTESQSPSESASGVTVGPATVSGPLGSEPVVTIDTTVPASEELTKGDLVEGTGAEVVATSTVTAHYVGYGATSGKMFDASWSTGAPAEFPLANVITGWQEGLLGMKVGGRRVLVIPGSMGYGAAPPQGSGILPNETLVFVVDLTAVK